MNDIVNPQITDAVTQTNVKVLAESPAMAMSSVYQAMAHSTGLLFENAVAAQQQQAVLAQAATTVGVMQLYGLAAQTADKIANSDVPDNLLSLLTALRAGTSPIASFADVAREAAATAAEKAVPAPAPKPATAPKAASAGKPKPAA